MFPPSKRGKTGSSVQGMPPGPPMMPPMLPGPPPLPMGAQQQPGMGMDPMQAMMGLGGPMPPMPSNPGPPPFPAGPDGMPVGGSMPGPDDMGGGGSGSELLDALMGTLGGGGGGGGAYDPNCPACDPNNMPAPGTGDPSMGLQQLLNLLAMAQMGVGGARAGQSGAEPDIGPMGFSMM